MGHEGTWSSSRNIGGGRESTPYINILLIAYSFMCGLHFDQLKVTNSMLLCVLKYSFQAFCDRCNILFVSSTTFYRFKRKVLYPVIWCFWLMHQAQNLAEIMVVWSLFQFKTILYFFFIENWCCSCSLWRCSVRLAGFLRKVHDLFHTGMHTGIHPTHSLMSADFQEVESKKIVALEVGMKAQV